MKESFYNIWLDDIDGRKLCYNAITSGFASFDDHSYGLLKKIVSGEINDSSHCKEDEEIIKNIKLGHFVVRDGKDEKAILRCHTKLPTSQCLARPIPFCQQCNAILHAITALRVSRKPG